MPTPADAITDDGRLIVRFRGRSPGGDVWQWNEADIFGDGSARGLRGGSWLYSSSTMASYIRVDGYPTIAYSEIGFRVASVPEPASVVMALTIAATGLLFWKRLYV